MSIGSAAAATIGGMWDIFDRVNGLIDWQIGRLQRLDDEDADSLIDFDMVDGEITEAGGRDEMLEQLEAAKVQIDAVCLLCQRTEAEMPD